MTAPTESPGLSGSAAFLSQRWLVRLRAGLALGGAILVVAAEYWGGWSLPAGEVLALLALVLASSVALSQWLRAGRSIPPMALAFLLVLDLAVLTAVLALTGGASNPFSSAFLIPIAVAALLLPTAHCAGVVTAAIAAYSLLYLGWPARPDPAQAAHGAHAAHAGAGQDILNAHLLGMWVAFVLVGPMMAYAVTRLRGAIEEAEAQLAESRRRQARAERLASLATLSAGAAHELATPLGTIAVVARELERRAQDPDVLEDARLVREEIDRCSEILAQLAVDAGAGTGEAAEPTRVGDLLDALAASDPGVRVHADPALRDRKIVLPARLFTRALQGLITNARQASDAGAPIELHARGDEAALVLAVEDSGCGMDDDVRRRAGEPFFTTKATGRGMGLGLFFAHSVIEQLGGTLQIESTVGRGTRVEATLPWAART